MLPLQLPFVKRRSPNDLSDGCKTLLNRSCLEPLEARILVWADLVSTTVNLGFSQSLIYVCLMGFNRNYTWLSWFITPTTAVYGEYKL